MNASTILESTADFPAIWQELGITQEYMDSYKLPAQREAKDIRYMGMNSMGRDIYLTPEAAERWERMKAAAKRDGIVLMLSHGFRSIGLQTKLIRNRLKKGQTLDQILTCLAVPGFSEHHTGRAIDVGTDDCFPPTQDLAKTKAYGWMLEYAADFNFHLTYPENNPYGIIFEPWHWCCRVE